LTFVSSFLSVGHGVHGDYEGWDEFLGLTWGEDSNITEKLDLPALLLPSFGDWGKPSDFILALWLPAIGAAGCNTLFNAPADQFPNDVSFEVKPIMTWKFSAAAAERRLAGKQAPFIYDPAAINIALHYRVGDSQPTPEGTLFSTVGFFVSAFLAAGLDGPLRIHLHAEGSPVLSHFGVDDLTEGSELVTLEVHTDLDARATFWHLANADVFIGSQSEFSRLVGMTALRPLIVLHHTLKAFCVDTAICCDYAASCIETHVARIEAAAARLVAAQRCGDWGAHSATADEAWPLNIQYAQMASLS
jgi:hypothetical protein